MSINKRSIINEILVLWEIITEGICLSFSFSIISSKNAMIYTNKRVFICFINDYNTSKQIKLYCVSFSLFIIPVIKSSYYIHKVKDYEINLYKWNLMQRSSDLFGYRKKTFFLQKCEKSIIVLNWNTLIHTHTSKWVNNFFVVVVVLSYVIDEWKTGKKQGKEKTEREREREMNDTAYKQVMKWTLYKFGY